MSEKFLAMSDEDFLKENPPEISSDTSTPEPTENTNTEATPVNDQATNTDPNGVVEETGTGSEAPTEEVVEDKTQNTENNSGQEQTSDVKENTEGSSTNNSSTATNSQPSKEGTVKPEGETPEPDFASIGQRVLAPFKANGKTITPRNADEAIQLMQMGANYTQKMQQIQPYRKVIAMLQNADLMDEAKINFLVDLSKKDPEAIKKLVKDSGIDPMDMDVSVEPNYKPGKNQVSDKQVNFQDILDTLTSTPDGVKTLTTINDTWDTASKQLLGETPELMTAIQSQIGNGIYARIVQEIDHLKTLGRIPASKPFIEAYNEVGNLLDQQGAFKDLVNPPPVQTVATPVATTTAPVKQKLVNSDKASAASPSRGTGSKTPVKSINPLAMSDEEFMKQAQNRV